MNTTPRLIDQLVNMTSIRDVDLLEVSLLKTLQGVRHTESLSLFKVAGSGKVLTEISYKDERCAIKQGDVQLSVELTEAFSLLGSQSKEEVHVQVGGLTSMVLCARISRRYNTYLVMEGATLSGMELQVISTLLQFYSNFCDLLQDAQTDPLTGLANRKTFDEVFGRFQAGGYAARDEEHAIERRHHKSDKHWVAMVDIDHFKQINDRFGHLFGDEVLILLAQQFKRSLRVQDEVFRFGGEEFVLIVSCDSEDLVKTTMDRLRENVMKMAVPQVEHITVSIGVTQITADSFAGTLLDYADKALYHSKSSGRNRVTLFEDLVQQGLAQYEAQPEGSIDFF